MRKIDMKKWPRRKHFALYNAFDHPHFSMCANVDVTAFLPAVTRRGVSFTVATTYVLTRAAHAIPEFRRRIRGKKIVEHDIVHPSVTILTEEELFSFCMITYTEDFPLFAERASERIAHVKKHPTLEDEPGHDDLLFMSAIPWVSFTSCTHPMHLNPPDSVPRIAWGKIFEEGDALKMPLGVQVHHALMDGIHVGKFYREAQDYLRTPDSFL
jgi:chloramphenicol O-acetyltransferase type A